jgi:hypothetical protein
LKTSVCPRLHKQLHQYFIVLDTVDDHLSCQPATFSEPETLVESVRTCVRASNLDDELSISRVTGERHGGIPQRMTNAAPPPRWQKERADLTDVSRGTED